jgi:hypothetical protein
MQISGVAKLSWPLVFKPLHDALMEDSLDRAEEAITGDLERRRSWSPYVRVLRRTLRTLGVGRPRA